MGSPIRFRSPSIFKRKNKKDTKKGVEDNDSIASSITSIKEGRIFDYLKSATTKNSARKSGSNNSNASYDDQSIDSYESDDEQTIKEFDRTDSSSSLDKKGKEYVVECLGFGAVGEPQPVQHQYRFVKAQIEKTKEKFIGQKVAKAKL